MKSGNIAIIACFLTILTYNLRAQDLIVTSDGDSLNCKITKQRDGFVYFKYLQNDQVKATLLPANKITSLIQDYYATPVIPKSAIQRRLGYDKWRYGIHGGYSYRTAKVNDLLPAQYVDYMKKLKSGFVVSGDIHYFPNEPLGFGIKYNLNKYKHNDGGSARDDITMHYVAASMLNRYLFANSRSSVLLGLNIGLQSYKDLTLAPFIGEVEILGKTAGIGFELGFDHKLSRGAALHFGAGFTTATLYQITIKQGALKETRKLEKEEYEGLSRIDLVVGLKFGK